MSGWGTGNVEGGTSGCSDVAGLSCTSAVRHQLHSVLSPSHCCCSIPSEALSNLVWSCFLDFSLALQEVGSALPADSVSRYVA